MASLGKYGRSGVGRSGAAWTMTQHSAGGTQTWRIDGIENVTRNVNVALEKMKLQSTLGMVTAARFVLTDADIGTPPLVPEDMGKLRSDTFVTPSRPGAQVPVVRFGYNANYAAAVHEMLISPSGKPINWNRPGSGPKFLEASLKRNTEKILVIVGKYAEL